MLKGPGENTAKTCQSQYCNIKEGAYSPDYHRRILMSTTSVYCVHHMCVSYLQ